MSSVDVGRPFEEEQQLEKKQQVEGCGSEEEEKPRKMGDEAEDVIGPKPKRTYQNAFDYPVETETDSESETVLESETETDVDEDEGEGEGESEEMDEAEVQQPEKKHPGEGEGGQSDEEEPKQQKVKDHKDHDFMRESQIFETGYGSNEPEPASVLYGLDFDSNDSGDEGDQKVKVIEKFPPSHVLPVYALQDKIQGGRNCLKIPRCGLFQHKRAFRGLPLFELFKVKLILNKERNPSLLGKLYGAIESRTSRENPDPISYYSAKKEDAVPIHLGPGNNSISLPLTFPKVKALTLFSCWIDMRFAFKFEYENKDEPIDVFEEHGFISLYDEVYYDYGSGSHQAKSLFMSEPPSDLYEVRKYTCAKTKLLGYPNSDIMRVAAHYAVYDGAWATVDVKILKEDVTKYYGFIFARPCIFKSRIRLLSVPEKDQMCELQVPKSVKLARQVVAVPTFCSLVITALLYDQDGKEFVRDKTLFKVLPHGKYDDKFIGKGGVHIEVKWSCENPSRLFNSLYV